jgi:2-polyprenyl-3-methyl-5-hydroxy-6-metoxy-1,4-benzoquinol methylase
MTPSVLTLFTTCKPFAGEFDRIQRNALTSWSRLRPSCEILVFGDEPGVADCCRTVGARQIKDVPRSEYGTPLMNGLFESAERVATSDLLGCVNADIMLTGDVLPAVRSARARFPWFLLIVRRWNTPLDRAWDFSDADWEARLHDYARAQGALEPVFGGIDLFVYPRGLWRALPPFAIGRGRWDSALIYQARKLRVPVIDATEVITCVHQNHGYGHHPEQAGGVFKGPEAIRNHELLGGEEFILSALNATHVLTSSGIRRRVDIHPVHVLRKMATLPALYPAVSSFAPLVRRSAPVWRRARRLLQRGWRWIAMRRHQRTLPYPVTISELHRFGPVLPEGGGVKTFDQPESYRLNQARLDHLGALGLPLQGKSVLDVGCGVGHLARFFVGQGCDVLCVDGRKENIDRLRTLYPERKARLFDVENEHVADLGTFDIVFVYGLLYHLENPFRAIRELGAVCREMLLLETMVVDHAFPVVRMQEETSTYSQALAGVGCRPSPSFVALALRTAGFSHVYAPLRPPDYPDFHFTWKNDLNESHGGHQLRCVFVASRRSLDNPQLVSLLSPA